MVLVVPTTSLDRGEVHTSSTRTLEYRIIAARHVVMPTMSSDEQTRMDRFQRLFTPHFEGDA